MLLMPLNNNIVFAASHAHTYCILWGGFCESSIGSFFSDVEIDNKLFLGKTKANLTVNLGCSL